MGERSIWSSFAGDGCRLSIFVKSGASRLIIWMQSVVTSSFKPSQSAGKDAKINSLAADAGSMRFSVAGSDDITTNVWRHVSNQQVDLFNADHPNSAG